MNCGLIISEDGLLFPQIMMWYSIVLEKKFIFYIDGLIFICEVKKMEVDTIAAISTPMGEGAIAIVRLSGDEAILIADKLFRSIGGKKLTEAATHTIHYGHLLDPKSGQVVEEVMVSVMKGPKTFTKEDVVEINCHGGIVSVNRVLQQVSNKWSETGGTRRVYKKGIFKWTD